MPINGDETRNGVPARAETSDVRAGVPVQSRALVTRSSYGWAVIYLGSPTR